MSNMHNKQYSDNEWRQCDHRSLICSKHPLYRKLLCNPEVKIVYRRTLFHLYILPFRWIVDYG